MKQQIGIIVAAALLLGANVACSPKEAQNTPTDVKAAAGSPAPQKEAAAPVQAEADISALLDPSKLNTQAPEEYKVKFTTSKGDVVLALHRAWAPLGVDRFYNLVKAGFFSDIAIFRVVPGFVAQFGIHGKPLVSDVWKDARIADDPVKQSNKRGTIVFATAGPNTRTTQLFINFADNPNLDQMGFSPIGEVVEGLEIVDSINAEYSEKPDQGSLTREGNTYLKTHYPRLDYIQGAAIVEN